MKLPVLFSKSHVFTSSSTSTILNEVRGGRRRSASALDGPSTGRRSGPWVEGGHEDADTQFREYSWNRKILNIPSVQEIYRGGGDNPRSHGSDQDAMLLGRKTESGLEEWPPRIREGKRDVAESYGPSTSRSNILANLCPIKINQTPSRSAVSVHQRRATINLRHLLAAV